MQLRPKTAGRGVVSRILAVVALGAVVMAACSGDDDTADRPEDTTSTSTSSTSLSTTTTEPTDPTAAAAEVWEQAWETAGQAETSADDLAAIASPTAAERLVATLHAGADPNGGFTGRAVTNHASVEENADGTFAIQDCLLINPPVAVGQANWYSGTVADVDGQLKVTGVEPEVVTGCVPASVADEVRVANDTFWSFLSEGVTAEDGDFLGITTGEYAEYIPSFLAQHEGSEFRAVPAERHPEIIEYRDGFISISDCQQASPDTGFFDLETGERRSGHAMEQSGSKNAVEVQFSNVDGEWRVASFGYLTGSNCEHGPTSLAIAEVG